MSEAERKRRVVITGMGAITPLGLDVATTWDALVQGRSGVAPIATFDIEDLDVKIAAEVKGFDPLDYFERKEARRIDRFAQLGMAAADEAIRDADLAITPENADRIGVLTGSCIGGIGTLVEQTGIFLDRGPSRVSPFLVPMFMSNMLSGQIATRTGAKGPNFSITSACATSGHSLGEATEIIRRGAAEVMIAGGSEASVIKLAVAAFDAMRALSTRNDEPERASRPFDRDRDGFVIGEGAGVMVLEELEHAQRRGARIYAELVGYGATADAGHITSPHEHGEGAARAMRIALCQAGLEPREIGYLNAHATSTPAGDDAETIAIKTVFAEQAIPPVSSTKSMTGHLLGAGGAIEALACVKAITDGCLPPTINLENPAPGCDLDYIPNVARPAQIKAALSNSFGFGGQNSALIVRRLED
jgi:3-oxoacyl-[acyl-carrier-protein] synthase II